MSVYMKLVKVQSELKAPKGQYNSFGKYAYRNCEDILEALKPILAENKCLITLSDAIVQVGERYYIEATARLIDAENGEIVEVKALAREEENKKGMDSSQLTGSTSSYARKYALNGLFAIDDTKDSDTTNTHGKGDSKASTDNKNIVTGLSEGQIKRLYAIAYGKGIKRNEVDELVLRTKKKAVGEMTKEEYEKACEYYEKMEKK